jgi:hypothetical protein
MIELSQWIKEFSRFHYWEDLIGVYKEIARQEGITA